MKGATSVKSNISGTFELIMITMNIRGLHSKPKQVILQQTLAYRQNSDLKLLGETHLTQDLPLAGLRNYKTENLLRYTPPVC